MERIYLNLKETKSCYESGGHRTSDGWVNSYRIDKDYSLTSSRKDVKIPLNACAVLKRLFAKYIGSYDYKNDRYGSIDEYNYVHNIDISESIKELNDIQGRYEFIQSSETLDYSVIQLISNSEQEALKVLHIINNCNVDLENQIKTLQEKNKKQILTQTFPHIKNLITEGQLDFFVKLDGIGYYPLDILAIHNEHQLLIENILKFKNPTFERFNEIYTIITTGSIPYFDILNGTVSQLNDTENLILSNFLRNMETRYRHQSYDSIFSSFSKSHLLGLSNLFGHLLTEIGVHKCYTMINFREYSSLPESQRSVFSFHARYLFPFFIIALLSEEEDLTETSFFEKYRYKSGFNDIPFILDRHGIYFNQLIPYFKKILQNSNAVEIFGLILHRSVIEQYDRDRFKNREILSCKNNKEKCVEFVKKTLQEFTHNE